MLHNNTAVVGTGNVGLQGERDVEFVIELTAKIQHSFHHFSIRAVRRSASSWNGRAGRPRAATAANERTPAGVPQSAEEKGTVNRQTVAPLALRTITRLVTTRRYILCSTNATSSTSACFVPSSDVTISAAATVGHNTASEVTDEGRRNGAVMMGRVEDAMYPRGGIGHRLRKDKIYRTKKEDLRTTLQSTPPTSLHLSRVQQGASLLPLTHRQRQPRPVSLEKASVLNKMYGQPQVVSNESVRAFATALVAKKKQIECEHRECVAVEIDVICTLGDPSRLTPTMRVQGSGICEVQPSNPKALNSS